jgi:hypothetical protein
MNLNAQVALRTGFNLSRLSSEQPHTKTNMVLRYHLGVSFRGFKLGENTQVKPELLLSWRGQNFKYDETFDIGVDSRKIETEYKDKFTYLDWMWPVNFTLSSKIYMEMGLYGGLRLSGKKKGETTVTDSGTSSKTDTYSEDGKYGDKDLFPDGQDGLLFNRPLAILDGGLIAGGGYKFTDKISFALRYQYGLVDVFRNNYPFKAATKGFQGFQVIQFSTLVNLGK